MAAKKTSEIIPLCHSINLSNINIDFKINEKKSLKILSKVVLIFLLELRWKHSLHVQLHH